MLRFVFIIAAMASTLTFANDLSDEQLQSILVEKVSTMSGPVVDKIISNDWKLEFSSKCKAKAIQNIVHSYEGPVKHYRAEYSFNFKHLREVKFEYRQNNRRWSLSLYSKKLKGFLEAWVDGVKYKNQIFDLVPLEPILDTYSQEDYRELEGQLKDYMARCQ